MALHANTTTTGGDGSQRPRLLSQQLRRHYLSIIALACFATIAYNQIVWDDNADEGLSLGHRQLKLSMADLKLQRQMDDAFRDAQHASSKKFTPRRLSRPVVDKSAMLEPHEALAYDGSTTTSDAGDTCEDLGITDAVVVKSRITGNTQRWHNVVEKMKDDKGPTVKVAVLGGSVPAGSECEEGGAWGANFACAWPAQLETMMHEHSFTNVEFVNLAHGGTPSSAGLTQIMELDDYDAIIIQWTTNDDQVIEGFGVFKGREDNSKPQFETLIRTALSLPKRPAVIIFESLGMSTVTKTPEPAAETMHYAIANVYELPVISARAAFWRQKSFDVQADWSNNSMRGRKVHPKAIWHKRFACLMYDNWINESSETAVDMSDWLDPMDQPPVFGGSTLHCQVSFSASAYKETLEGAPSHIDEGWSYYADAPTKFGYISNTTDSTLQFEMAHDTTDKVEGATASLYIHYLRSYTPEWGSAQITVQGERPEKIDARWDDHASQIEVLKMDLKSSDEPYQVTIKNLGGKVKIVELVLFSCTPES